MTITEIKQRIYNSSSIDADWENDRTGTLHQIQAQAEYILSEELTAGRISYSESRSLLTKLMADYGSAYPLKV